MVEINGVKFAPRPDCAYRHDYVGIAGCVKSGVWFDGSPCDELSVYRALILADLWFIVYFVLKVPTANHPFVVGVCREVEDGPNDSTLDVWAREHFKSTVLTVAETIQFCLREKGSASAIFSHTSPVAKKFLFTIKETFQHERILASCFPDVVWANCEKESPMWSVDGGLILKRDSSRPEPSVSAWGLIEGMPTGMHFDRRVYDDISTEDLAESAEQMEKVKTKFDSSQNLGKEGGHHRVIGTYYHNNDPLVYIREKKKMDGGPRYHYRLKPATDDGTVNGKPVFLSRERYDFLRFDRSFNCQQLLDPTPITDRRLNPDYLVKVNRADVPTDVWKCLLVDQAGDAGSAKSGGGDAWAVGVLGVVPKQDDLGQSDVYLLDLWIEPSTESAAIEHIVRMYLRAGIVSVLGVEKTGLATTHIHVANALGARGRHIEFGDELWSTGRLLRPAGREKRKKIESALSWPLNNSKIHYCEDIPAAYIDRLKQEMSFFPRWHDDGLDMLAYLWDLLKEGCVVGSGWSSDRDDGEQLEYERDSCIVA